MHLRRVTTALISASLVLLVFAAGTAQGLATNANIEVTFKSPEEADVAVEQTWEDQDAVDFRQSLDVLFGNADGDLTEEEVTNVEDATEADMQNASFAMVSLDGTPSRVKSATVTLDDAVGDVESQETFSMTHDIVVGFEKVNAEGSHELVLEPPWNGTFSVVPPDGWAVDEEGSSEGVQAVENGTITGDLQSQSTVTIAFSDGSGGTEGSDGSDSSNESGDSGNASGGSGPSEALGVSSVPLAVWIVGGLILAAIALAAGFMFGRKRA